MAVSKAEILDAIAGMTVLELSEMIKEMEEKFGVSAAAAAVAAAPAGGGGAAAPVAEEKTEFDVILVGNRREQGQRHQGRSRDHGPRPEGSEGPGRRRAEAGQGSAFAKADAEAAQKKLVEAGAKADVK